MKIKLTVRTSAKGETDNFIVGIISGVDLRSKQVQRILQEAEKNGSHFPVVELRVDLHTEDRHQGGCSSRFDLELASILGELRFGHPEDIKRTWIESPESDETE